MAFGIPNNKSGVLLDVLNVSNFCNMLQYRCIFDTVRTTMEYEFIIIFIHLSLSSQFFIWFFLSLLRICLSTNPCSSSSYNRTWVAQKNVMIATKRGGKVATTLSKSGVTAASDSQNGAEKLANGVEALLISDLSL